MDNAVMDRAKRHLAAMVAPQSTDMGKALALFPFTLADNGGGCTAYEWDVALGKGWSVESLDDKDMAPTSLDEAVHVTRFDASSDHECLTYSTFASLRDFLISLYVPMQEADFARRGWPMATARDLPKCLKVSE